MNGRGKKRWTAGLKTYNQQPAIKELILLILYGGAAEWNSSFHPIQLKQKVKLFILIEWNESWRVSWNEIKMYYNSNLYEADSYLVIIIECFCEEWTNTWNWLRGELVAEYKGWMEPILFLKRKGNGANETQLKPRRAISEMRLMKLM